jgi:hypothetical protein
VAGGTIDPHNIWISDIHNPFYYPVGLQLRPDPNGDHITALTEFHGAIIVGRMHDVYVIYGNTNRTDVDSSIYRMSKINTHTGIISDATVAKVNNYLFYLGGDGVVYSTQVEMLQTRIMNRTVDLKSAPINLDMSDMLNACAVFKDNVYYLSIADKILLYSYDTMSWSVWDGLNARSFLILNYELLFGADNGHLYKYGVGYSDDGVAISAYWSSKRFDMGAGSRMKKFKSMYVVAHSYDDVPSTIHIDFEIDYAEVSTNIDYKSMISTWGSAIFGERFIKWNINKSEPIPINRRGRLIRFIFGNEVIDEAFKVYEINGEYILKGFR